MMDDLVAFIRARIDEDERIARRAASDAGEHWNGEGVSLEIELDDGSYETWQVGEHTSRHDPARVLRGVEARRRIVEVHEHQTFAFPEPTTGAQIGCIVCHSTYEDFPGGWCDTLRAVASEWSTHPDYQAGWAS